MFTSRNTSPKPKGSSPTTISGDPTVQDAREEHGGFGKSKDRKRAAVYPGRGWHAATEQGAHS